MSVDEIGQLLIGMELVHGRRYRPMKRAKLADASNEDHSIDDIAVTTKVWKDLFDELESNDTPVEGLPIKAFFDRIEDTQTPEETAIGALERLFREDEGDGHFIADNVKVSLRKVLSKVGPDPKWPYAVIHLSEGKKRKTELRLLKKVPFFSSLFKSVWQRGRMYDADLTQFPASHFDTYVDFRATGDFDIRPSYGLQGPVDHLFIQYAEMIPIVDFFGDDEAYNAIMRDIFDLRQMYQSVRLRHFAHLWEMLPSLHPFSEFLIDLTGDQWYEAWPMGHALIQSKPMNRWLLQNGVPTDMVQELMSRGFVRQANDDFLYACFAWPLNTVDKYLK